MRKKLMTALIPMSLTLASLPAAAQTTGDRPDYGHYGWDWGWGHMMFGSLMMILFWGGIILAIVFAVRWLGGATSHSAAPPTSRKSALDILQDRFARGEIDKDEFEERKRLLSD
jgi:putative membrane protein